MVYIYLLHNTTAECMFVEGEGVVERGQGDQWVGLDCGACLSSSSFPSSPSFSPCSSSSPVHITGMLT